MCVLLKGNKLFTLQDQLTHDARDKTLPTNIPDCHGWTEERKNVPKCPFGTIASAGAFLILAAAW